MKFLKAFLLSSSILLSPSIARADVAGDLQDFWENSGGGVNVSKPTFYEGQRAGYAGLGSIQVRTRSRQTNLAHIQLPSVRAGCGGIDIFGGSFSFISQEELIKLMEAIMQNASGFAFELALESMSPAVQETVAKLRDLVQQVNSMNINSCETGQLIAGALWPKIDSASQHICATIGSYQGMFADRVAAKHGCGSNSGQSQMLNNANAELKDQVPLDINYAWKAIKKNPFLSSDSRLAEFFMSLTGTMITRSPANEGEGPQHDSKAPLAISDRIATILVEGGTAKIWVCDEDNKCLNPTLQNVTIPHDKALLAKTSKTLMDTYDAIKTPGGTIPPEAVAMLGMTSIPVYEHIVTGVGYKHIFVESEIDAMAELVAVDLAMIYIDQALNEISASAGQITTFGELTIEYQNQVKQTQQAFAARRQIAQERYAAAFRSLERLALAKQELAGNTSSIIASMLK
jgi:conjugative transfer pilus assembly protein TraH